MIKKLALFFIMLIISTAFSSELNNTTNNNYYTVINDNSQQFFKKKKNNKPCLCEDENGKKLVSCIFALNHQEMHTFFMLLPIHKKREFLKNLSLAEYEYFITSYTEQEWHQLYESLAEYEKQLWPSTVKEQTESLNNIKEYANTAGKALGYTSDAMTLINPFLVGIAVFNNVHSYVTDERHEVKSIKNSEFNNYMEITFEL